MGEHTETLHTKEVRRKVVGRRYGSISRRVKTRKRRRQDVRTEGKTVRGRETGSRETRKEDPRVTYSKTLMSLLFLRKSRTYKI